MDAGTARNRRSYLSVVLEEAGYVKRIRHGRAVEFQLLPDRDWRRISVEDFSAVLAKWFPAGQLSVTEKSRHDNYAKAIRTFAEYGLELGLWGQEKRLALRSETMLLVRESEYEEVSINRPEIAHPFEEWLRTRTGPITYSTNNGARRVNAPLETIRNDAMMIYLGQWLAMRYEETTDVRADLKILAGGSLEIDWRSMSAKILGKGQRGKTRSGIPVLPEVQQRIEDFLAYREQSLGPESETYPWLLWIRPHRWGQIKPSKYPPSVGPINDRVRGYAEAYNEEVRAAGRVDLLLDVSLCTTHKLGRHVFGTWFGPRIDPKILKKAMGITMDAVAERYRNYGDTSVREMFMAAAGGAEGPSKKSVKVPVVRSQSGSSSSGEIVCRKCDVSFPEYELWARHQKEFHGGEA